MPTPFEKFVDTTRVDILPTSLRISYIGARSAEVLWTNPDGSITSSSSTTSLTTGDDVSSSSYALRGITPRLEHRRNSSIPSSTTSTSVVDSTPTPQKSQTLPRRHSSVTGSGSTALSSSKPSVTGGAPVVQEQQGLEQVQGQIIYQLSRAEGDTGVFEKVYEGSETVVAVEGLVPKT
ncbi:hypothetical protein HK102_007482, partial [Quaeritorhiza haematococci]